MPNSSFERTTYDYNNKESNLKEIIINSKRNEEVENEVATTNEVATDETTDETIDYDYIILGFTHFNNILKSLENNVEKSKLIIILNKEYNDLEEKLEWISNIGPKNQI